MLVLTRKKDERILIGEAIEVTVVGIRNGKVRLGFSCPADISILREEVYQRELASRVPDSAKKPSCTPIGNAMLVAQP